jgi:DNA-binding transcriptional MerR regulator
MSARLHHLPMAHVLEDPPAGPVQLQVGDLAKRSGKTVRALHLYEELGLLRPLGRSKGRYRLYGEDALVRIRWIGKLQDLGLSLHEIRALAQEAETVSVAPQVAERMRGIYEQKLQDTREQLQKLKELESELETALVYLQECSSLCAPARTVHECRSCELRGEDASGCHGTSDLQIPDLVRGYQLTSEPVMPLASQNQTTK